MLKSDVLKALNKPVVSNGTWSEVFGKDADEYFHAWSVARYIEFVAAAGKAVNPLPLYVNAALRDPLSNPSAGTYESGGPTDNVISIWKAAAPSIDLLAPDIYLSGSERVLKVLELYSRSDNALLVPEIGSNNENVKYLYKVLAHGGIGFSPFGIDNNGEGTVEDANKRFESLGKEYSVLSTMMREMAEWAFEGKISAVVEPEDHSEQTIDLGSWEAIVTFGGGRRGMQSNDKPVGKGMVVKLDDNEFLLTGTNCRFTFKPSGKNEGKPWQYLKVEEGTFENGKFNFLRIRNGDETDWGGPHIGTEPVVLKATLVVR